MATKTILLVDDTESNIDILVELLSAYDLLVATDGQSAIEIAHEEKIDLILLDIVMPEMDGFDVCRKLKSSDQTNTIPIIFITARTDEESIEKAYEVGGLDYVTKPFKQKELLARVSTQLKLRSLIDHLEFISSHDPLTGIHNRRKFFELAQLKFKHHKDDLYAVMIDIDRFKNINDTYGHPMGDCVLKAIATTLQQQIPEEAVFGRIGGEEFAVAINMADEVALVEYIEKIRMTIAGMVVKSDDGALISFTISNGIAKMKDSCSSLDHLLKNADDALYEAKRSGRNKSIFRNI